MQTKLANPPIGKIQAKRDKRRSEPFFLHQGDPANFWGPDKPKIKYPNKVLTNLNHKNILKAVIKLKKKDDKMTKAKSTNLGSVEYDIKVKTNKSLRLACLLLLAGAAVVGVTNLLGGGLRDAVVATLLVVLLFVHAAQA